MARHPVPGRRRAFSISASEHTRLQGQIARATRRQERIVERIIKSNNAPGRQSTLEAMHDRLASQIRKWNARLGQ